MERSAHPIEILDVKRAIEAIEMGGLRDLLGLGRVAGERRGEVAREAQQGKTDDRHRHGDEHGDRCAVNEKPDHRVRPWRETLMPQQPALSVAAFFPVAAKPPPLISPEAKRGSVFYSR